jgi:cation diffusion facilitator CzcD-associated flavoprotein CzcO
MSETPHYAVAILGAGFGGLGMAARLKASGERSFVILEKADRIGGTWRDNIYPGCACDVPSHLYWYSFDRPPDWSRVFSPQPEILDNMASFVDRHGLGAHLRFNAEIVEARWDEARGHWHIGTKAGATVTARSFVAATGQLNRPKFPALPGRDSFTGLSFHSAQWPAGIDLEGQRVAVVGNGASAVQIVPEVAKVASRLAVFQRSASYIVPRLDRAYTPQERQRFVGDDASYRASRDTFYRDHESRHGQSFVGHEVAKMAKAIALQHLKAQVPDEELRERLTPDYVIGCKRILLSDDFYPTLQRPNVELVTEAVTAVKPKGLGTADGYLHPADVIIYATGFETFAAFRSMSIIGRGGAALNDVWAAGPSAYLGISVAGFPNFFMLYGPNTNLGHNSIIAMLECQFDYVRQGLTVLADRPAASLDVRPAAMARFNRDLQDELHSAAWSSNCNNWYKTADGHLSNNWTGTVDAYRARTARFDLDAYEVTDAAAIASA